MGVIRPVVLAGSVQVKWPSRISLTAVLLIACLGMQGCAQVAPWQRGVLAKPQMALDPNPLQSNVRAHNLSSREAAASINSSGGGGGCGCY